MTEEVRILLYPLGYVAQVLFGLRFIVQWMQSEKKKKSIVPKSFWLISCAGNFLLALHGYIQLQFPLMLLQCIGLAITLRNLDLLGKPRLSFFQMVTGSLLFLSLMTLAFFLHSDQWMRTPGKEQLVPFPLHIIGTIGMILFASRFWLQWWQAERHQKSELRPSFWWMSFWGAFLSLTYFLYLGDPVNIIGYGLGLIPYMRNLRLIKKGRFSFTPQNTLFFLAAEKSGDHLGAKLISSLKLKLPTTRFIGVGGEEMSAAGMKQLIASDQFEVMGLTALFPAALRLFRNFHKIKRMIEQEKPKMVVLIDYAEFNMLLAAALRKGGYQGKVVQYVIPSVWAWRKGRTKKLVRNYDLLLSILPFEVDHFPLQKEKVAFVGHPLTDIAEGAHLKKEKALLALFPGSREHEIKDNLPYQLEAAKRVASSMRVAISVASKKLEKSIIEIANRSGIAYHLVPGPDRYQLMQSATLSLSTCGTVILELALFKTPTVVVYKISYLNYLVGRYLFRIQLPYFSLPNILMKEELFPEFVDKKISFDKLSAKVAEVMARGEKIQEKCAVMRQLLLDPAKKKVAEEELYALFMS